MRLEIARRARALLGAVGRNPLDATMVMLALLWLVHALIVANAAEPIASDDAFISFHYARNLARGQGLVFNVGERVWGFTSPLQTLLLALLTVLGLDTVRAAFGLGLFSVSATALLLYRLGARITSKTFALAVAAFFLVDHSQHGSLALESNLLVALQVGFLLAVVCDAPWVASLLAALSCLTRPDSLLLVLPVLLSSRACRRPKVLGLFCLLGAVWELFAFCYFDSLVPQSYHAKVGLSRFLPFLRNAVDDVTSGGIAAVAGISDKGGLVVRVLVLGLSTLPLLNPEVRRRFVLWYGLVVYPWVLLLAYSWIGSVTGHNWEFYSARLAITVSAGFGIAAVVERLMRRSAHGSKLHRAVATAALALVATAALVHARDLERSFARARTSFWGGQRYHAFRRVAAWLVASSPADASLAVGEVGILGYFSSRRIIDHSGIVTRGYLPSERMNLSAFVRRYRPTYALMYHRNAAWMTLAPGLVYRRVAHFPNQGYAELTLLQRQD